MKTSWIDEDVGEGFGSSVDRFKVRDGFKDLIRIVSDPIKYFVHPVDFEPYYIGCNKQNGECPACEQKLSRKQRIGCLVAHIATKKIKGKGKWERIGLVKPWLFAGSRWFDIQQIIQDYPEVKKKGIKKCDLFATCKDEQFQDMIIAPTLQDSRLKKDMLADIEDAKEQLQFYTSGYDAPKQREILGLEDNGTGSETASDIAEDLSAEDTDIDIDDKAEEQETVTETSAEEVDNILDGIGDVPF